MNENEMRVGWLLDLVKAKAKEKLNPEWNIH
jgi:hypothetical protein